ncbi:AAA family ATPase, partial [Thiotrichales bacterium HSG1]|nr:AAA family ATPase [Thiotrichales bacterium HSG1]
PLFLYGNSINRMADIILQLVDNQDGILLIDEIETGIHHTKQKAVWQMLFDLAIQLKIQIFATTRSSCMQQAFNEVAGENEGISGFFEFTRHIKTNQITSIRYNKGSLEYGSN